MEPQFGRTFDQVRIHTDASANQLAGDLSAHAFTSGRDIVFGAGEFAPETPRGERLLAHELTHVVQQDGATDRVHRDFFDDVGDAVSTGYNEVRSAAGGAYDTAAGVVSEAYEGAKSTITSVGGAVTEGIDSAVKTVSAVAQKAGALASDVGNTLSTDPEKTRSELLRKVSGARAKARTVDLGIVVTNGVEVAKLNSQIQTLNATTGFVGATFVPTMPLWEAIGVAVLEMLEALAIGIAALTLWEVVVIAIIIIAIVLLILYLLDTSKTKPEQDTDTDTDPQSAPKPKPDGRRPPPPPLPPICTGPTGLTPLDPILIKWFKPRVGDYYPTEIVLDGHVYGRDEPRSTMPRGEPIGVEGRYWPHNGKIMQLIPETRGPGAERFRAVLARYGFSWAGLQADHVQDIEFGGPDDSEFVNLWPMDSSANTSAGARTNGQQITFCISTGTPVPYTGTFADAKRSVPSIYGRYFMIISVER